MYSGRETYGHAKKNPFAVCTEHKQEMNHKILSELAGVNKVLDAFSGEGRFAKIVEASFPHAAITCVEKDPRTFERSQSQVWASQTDWRLDDNIQVMRTLIGLGERFDLVDLDPFVSCRDQLELVWGLLKDKSYLFVTFGGEYRRSFIKTNRKAIQKRYGFYDDTLSNSTYLEVIPQYFVGWLAESAFQNQCRFQILQAVRYANNCRFWLSVQRDTPTQVEEWLTANVMEHAGGWRWPDLKIPRFSELRKAKRARASSSDEELVQLALPF